MDDTLYAGGCYTVVIVKHTSGLAPEPETVDLPISQPEWLRLQILEIGGVNEKVIDDLTGNASFKLQYFVDPYRLKEDTAVRQGILSGYFRPPMYCFSFVAPDSFVNRRIRIQVSDIEGAQDTVGFIGCHYYTDAVIMNMSSYDEFVRTSHLTLMTLVDSRRDEEVLQVVDTLLYSGHKFGTIVGYKAAARIGMFQKAIRYLDEAYRTYGSIESNWPSLQQYTVEQEQVYLRVRQSLEDKANQKQ